MCKIDSSMNNFFLYFTYLRMYGERDILMVYKFSSHLNFSNIVQVLFGVQQRQYETKILFWSIYYYRTCYRSQL